MSTFRDQLTGPNKDAAAADLAAFAERTVESQSGLSGKLVKGAYAAAKKIDANIAPKAARQLLPEVAANLEPQWEAYVGAGKQGGFGPFLAERKQQVAGMLLETADRKIESINNGAARKIYGPVRGKVAKIVEENVGGIGEVLEKHVS